MSDENEFGNSIRIRELEINCDAHHQILECTSNLNDVENKTPKEECILQQTEYWKVLNLCGQIEPMSFQEFLSEKTDGKWIRIGGGSYGEVYAVFDGKRQPSRVLKVVPIHGIGRWGRVQDSLDLVHPEIEASLISLVRGKLPKPLYKAWKKYSYRNRWNRDWYPMKFPNNQLYVVYEMEFSGYPLSKMPILRPHQAVSVVQQVACSLAAAEVELEFEHRDLHLCNVLVKPTSQKTLRYTIRGQCIEIATNGIIATIIDFTFSRFKKDRSVLYRDLKGIEFGGDGLRHKIYKACGMATGNNWKSHNPYTNILWLYYIASSMLRQINGHPELVDGEREGMAYNQLLTWKTTFLKYTSAQHFIIGAKGRQVSCSVDKIQNILEEKRQSFLPLITSLVK